MDDEDDDGLKDMPTLDLSGVDTALMPKTIQWLETLRELARQEYETLTYVEVESVVAGYGSLPLLIFFAIHDQEGFTLEHRVMIFKYLKACHIDPLQRGERGQTVLSYLARGNRVAIFKACLDLWPELQNHINQGSTHWTQAQGYMTMPLSLAVTNGRVEMTEELLKRGAYAHVQYNHETLFEMNALCGRIYEWSEEQCHEYEQGKIKIAQLLAEYGALSAEKIDAETLKKIRDKTLLRAFSSQRMIGEDLKFIQCLLSLGCDINAKDLDGNTILLCASHNKPLPLIKKLESLGADLHVVNKDGENAVLRASKEQPEEVIRYFLDKGVSPHAVDHHGKTALHYAIEQSGNPRIIRAFAALIRADVCHKLAVSDQRRESPWMTACWWGYKETLNILLEENKDKKSICMAMISMDTPDYLLLCFEIET